MADGAARPATAWMDVPPLVFPPLDRDCTADVCIVGAGIAGMSTAYSLACEGRSVVLLDDGPVGGGMTPRPIAPVLARSAQAVRVEACRLGATKG